MLYNVCELQYTKFKTQLKLTFWAREPNSEFLEGTKVPYFLKQHLPSGRLPSQVPELEEEEGT